MSIKINDRIHDVDVLYKYSNGHYDRKLDETIDELTKRRLPPDRILIVCPKGGEKHIVKDYSEVNSSTRERLRAVSHVTLIAYNQNGRVPKNAISQLHLSSAAWELIDEEIEEIIAAGIKDIVDATGTRMEAPPGYVFRKPSENVSNFFIRAGNMMRNPAALAVIFHAMIRILPFGIRRLYIDSSTILSIALNYQSSMEALARACGIDFGIPTITNIHSYSMDPNLKFEVTNDYCILISASSSGGLAQRLVSRHGARADCVFHLLVFSEKLALKKSAVYFEKHAQCMIEKVGSFQKVISIPGEDFLAAHGDTKTVDIRKSHFVESERNIYKDEFYQNTLGLNLSTTGSYGGAFRPIGFKFNKKIGSENFKNWLKNLARIAIPASTTIAIAADRSRSAVLARHLVSLIPSSRRERIPVVTLSDLQKKPEYRKMSNADSILVICSDESDGESLLAISQALRDTPHLHRHYVIGHLFPTSARQFKRLRSNLRINGKGEQYGWSVYCVTPVGDDSLHRSWLLEQSFNYRSVKCGQPHRNLQDAIKLRAERLNNSFLTGEDLFLPDINGKPLKLRNESVLFEGDYKNISHATVYVQMAGALQRARDRELHDDKLLPGDLCFENNPFIDTVIDPDTFSRFNDGIIQAAILRSAAGSELNYSRDEKISKHMFEIFTAVIKSRERNRGEAVLEFMLAASSKKLRLCREHFEELVKLIESESDLNAVWRCFKSEALF